MCHQSHLETPAQPGHEQLSADRPPQLNQTVCGCRCGRSNGSGEDGIGGSNDDDAASTLVASEESDTEDPFPAGPNEALQYPRTTRRPALMPTTLNELHARVEWFEGNSDVYQHAGHASTVSYPSGLFHDLGDTDSMNNEPGSNIHSVMPSEMGSVRGISPGPGMGAWTWAEEALPLSMDYYFVVTPLRLTPQHQYCRGLVASHLVLGDNRAFRNHRGDFYNDGSGTGSHLRRA